MRSFLDNLIMINSASGLILDLGGFLDIIFVLNLPYPFCQKSCRGLALYLNVYIFYKDVINAF